MLDQEELAVKIAKAIVDIRHTLSEYFQMHKQKPDKTVYDLAIASAMDNWHISMDFEELIRRLYFWKLENSIVNPGLNWAYNLLNKKGLWNHDRRTYIGDVFNESK